MKLKVKADGYQYVLYRADADVEHADDDPMDNMKGFRAVGHYTTIEALLTGIREHLLKSKAKKARDLEAFLKVVVSMHQELREEIKKHAFLAKKMKAPGGAS